MARDQDTIHMFMGAGAEAFKDGKKRKCIVSVVPDLINAWLHGWDTEEKKFSPVGGTVITVRVEVPDNMFCGDTCRHHGRILNNYCRLFDEELNKANNYLPNPPDRSVKCVACIAAIRDGRG